ncbi:MAG: sensor histidine kinase [Anaerolineales bacterium]
MDIITVYFFYGLSFFVMGLAVLLEVDRSSKLDFARALRSLAGFGLIHGGHEWIEMFLLIHPEILETSFYHYVGPGRVVLLATSFLFLISFGARMIAGSNRTRLSWQMLGVVTAIWLVGLIWLFFAEPVDSRLVAMDVYSRYSLAIPGAALTAWGMILQRQKFLQAGMKGFDREMIAGAVAFGLYGGVGQLFVASSNVFPSAFLNSQVFLSWFGFPIQFFRSVMACIAAVAIISSLRAFEQETQRQLEALRNAQLAERKRLDDLHAELMRRTVRAQELERQRIARELHDELGQTLTALGMGLRAISDNALVKPEKVSGQARQLQGVVDSGISSLQNLVSGLHPPQLDDLGLLAALRWYSAEAKERFGLTVTVTSLGKEAVLSIEIRTVLFRIVQESITNIIRHAKTDQADVSVIFDNDAVCICVEDKGSGFDVDATLHQPGYPCWGLLGMIERAALIGADCRFISEPGKGTRVEVRVPFQEKGNVENSFVAG